MLTTQDIEEELDAEDAAYLETDPDTSRLVGASDDLELDQ